MMREQEQNANVSNLTATECLTFSEPPPDSD